jgi:hypothetical protein
MVAKKELTVKNKDAAAVSSFPTALLHMRRLVHMHPMTEGTPWE